MNRKVLEIEPGTIRYQHFDATGMNRALNAWARRRGIVWESPFRKPMDFQNKMKTRPS